MKQSRYFIALLVVVFSSSGGAEPVKQDQARLASELKIPRIKMLEATPEEAFEFIRLKSKELDPAGLGVRLIVEPAKAPVTRRKKAGRSALESAMEPFPGASVAAQANRGESKPSVPTITFELTNVTILAAIQKTAEQARMRVEARPDSILVKPK